MDANLTDPILVAASQSLDRLLQANSAVDYRGGGVDANGNGNANGIVPANQHSTSATRRRLESADILELCRVYLLDVYLKRLGRVHAFDLLQQEHNRLRLNGSRSVLILVGLFSLTCLLQTSAYNSLISQLKRFTNRFLFLLWALIDFWRRNRPRRNHHREQQPQLQPQQNS